MGISCAIGLAVCLNFGDARLHPDDLIAALDTCDLVAQLHPNQFDGAGGYGVSALESLTDLGLEVDWTRPAARRKASALALCAALRAAANDRRNWS